jgi:PAS domain S-box-containing protein
LIREIDWSNTALGRPEDWPDTLRTALAVCLNSTIPSAVYWGSDFITLYNEAWANQQAGEHPWSMGRPARESRKDMWATLAPQFEAVMTSGRGFSVTDQHLPMQREGGSDSWWSYSIIPLHTHDGSVGGLLTQGFETTAQIRARQLLDQQSTRLRDMVRQAPGAIALLTGPRHVYEIANDAYFELVGDRDIIGKPTVEALPEIVSQGFIELLDNVFRTGEPFVGKSVPVLLHRGYLGEPEMRMVDFVYQPIRNAMGEVEDIFVEATDVTERVRGEAALAESEARFRGITNSIDQMIWSALPDGYHDFYNDRWYEYTGVPQGSTDGDGWNDIFHPDDQQRASALWSASLQTGEPYHIEYRLRHNSGQYRWVLGRAQAVRNDDGEIVRWFGTCTDIQDLVEAREVLSRSREELEAAVVERTAKLMHAEGQLRQAQKMEAIGQLTGGIAHDFNNMLAVVTGGLNLVQRKLSRGETDVGRYIEGALEGARRAASLTSRLLAFSRQQQLAPERIDANALVQGMTDLLTRTLGHAIRIETVLATDLWHTQADANQVESAILNLAVNARDAMEEGGSLTIETSNTQVDDAQATEFAIPAGDYVMIAVTDTGVGMTPEVAAKAFDPFFTTKDVGKGTGLGLSQVFGFMRQSGGHVKIRSAPGRGTTVKLYLPRSLSGATPVERAQAEGLAAHGSGETVMVVEDEERVRTHSVETLRELGYTVIEAATPADALRIIGEGQSVSLLFTDVVMPEMNGRQLVERAKEMRPDLKVLYTTGYTRNSVDQDRLLEPGAAYILKPFTIDQLAHRVRKMLDS